MTEHPPIPDEVFAEAQAAAAAEVYDGSEWNGPINAAVRAAIHAWTRDKAVVGLPDPDDEDADGAFWHMSGRVLGLVRHGDSPMVELTGQDPDDDYELAVTPEEMAWICRAGLAAVHMAEQPAAEHNNTHPGEVSG